MKTCLTLLALILFSSTIFSQAFNSTLMANWQNNALPTSGGLRYNDCWGYNAPNGTEVAILGTLQWVYFFDITDPSDPIIIDSFHIQNVNGSWNSSIWRDFKTYGNYCYGSSDQGDAGLLIFDLQYVPDSVVYVDQNRDFWLRSHNIWIDVAEGKLYAAGPNTNSAGTIVLDLDTDPENPIEIGSPTFPLGYIHDIHVIDHIAYASHGYDAALCIYDFTDPEDPELLKTLDGYPQAGYNHSAWLNADGTKLVFADETAGKALKLVNPNIGEPQTTNYKTFKSQLLANNVNSIAHNPFIIDDLCIIAYYHDGVQVFDISDTNNIVQVAYYDTYTNSNYNGYEGCWGVYPFLESGYIIASDVANGLFIIELAQSVLPLNIVAFDAVKRGNDALLSWKVTFPEDGESFIIEHSKDGVTFEALSEQSAHVTTLNYQTTDFDPGPGTHYYRVAAVYADGQKKPTAVKSVQFDMEDLLSIKPTITSDLLSIDTRTSGQLNVVSIDGRVLLSSWANALERMDVSVSHLPAGQYYVVLRSGDVESAKAFIKE